MAQLAAARPDIQIEGIRGNVDTRLRKLDEGQYDAIVLAAAGLRRLGWADRVTEYLPLDVPETTAACVEDPDEHGSAGTYGTFTFDVPGTDAVRYEYGFNTDPSPSNVLTPTAAGGPVSIQWLPTGDGPRWVSVRAIDKANNPSAIAKCFFTVATRNATGEWTMDDASGSSSGVPPMNADSSARVPSRSGDVGCR